MLTELSFQYDPNASDAELIDTIGDVMEVCDMVEDTLEDGFQVTDFFEGLKIQPKGTEVANDFPVFIAEAAANSPTKVKNAVLQARARTVQIRGSVGKVSTMIARAIFVLANNYEYSVGTYKGAMAQYTLWQTLISGAAMFPDEIQGLEEA